MNKDPKIFIEHILECINHVEEYLKGITKEEFLNNAQLQDAVIRRIEIIGEAVKNISANIKDKYPDIPWKQIAGMRDIIVHEYFGVDLDLVWKAAYEDIFKFRKNILQVKKVLKNRDG